MRSNGRPIPRQRRLFLLCVVLLVKVNVGILDLGIIELELEPPIEIHMQYFNILNSRLLNRLLLLLLMSLLMSLRLLLLLLLLSLLSLLL